MNHPLRSICVAVLGLAIVLQAQEADKPKAKQEPKAPAATAQKDDATTTNDKAIVALDAFTEKMHIDKKSQTWRMSLSAPPQQTFDPKSDYFWHVETTAGALKIRFLPDAAPMHVTSGIYLARMGFYDGVSFHRIIKNFMAQGGDPQGNGTGGPGYAIDSEFLGNLKHDRPGLLSMANTGRPKTDGSQFFLTFVPTPHLDGKHTIWGEVVEGMETVKALEAVGSAQGNVSKPTSMVRTWITVAPKPKAKDAEPPKDAKPAK